MKIFRKILLGILFIFGSGLSALAEYNGQIMIPTEDYIKRFKVCGAFQDVQSFETESGKGVTIYLKKVNTIVGIRDGKCYTKSTTLISGINQPLYSTKCRYTDSQRAKLVEKMESAKINKLNENLFKSAQKYYLSDPSICTIKRHMDD